MANTVQKVNLRILKYHEAKTMGFSFILSAFNTIVSLKHGFGFPYAKSFTTFQNMLVAY